MNRFFSPANLTIDIFGRKRNKGSDNFRKFQQNKTESVNRGLVTVSEISPGTTDIPSGKFVDKFTDRPRRFDQIIIFQLFGNFSDQLI